MAQTPSRRLLLALAGLSPVVAIPAAVAGLATDQMAAIPNASPRDAELIAACERHIANFYATMACDGDDDPRWDAYHQSSAVISEAKPVSLAGLVAKARVAKLEAQQPDGTEDVETVGGWWGWDLVNDLLRLGGEA